MSNEMTHTRRWMAEQNQKLSTENLERLMIELSKITIQTEVIEQYILSIIYELRNRGYHGKKTNK